MLRILPLFFVLFACASPAPSAYSQMAPGMAPPPRAPAFNPALDAPITTGQPGYVGPLEGLPQPKPGRTLPETPQTRREPGIWASTAPDAAPLTIADMPLDVLPEALVSPVAGPLILECTDGLGKAVWASREAATIHRFGDSTQRCLAAFLFRGCVLDNIAAKHRWREMKTPRQAELLKALAESAKANVNRLCGFREEKAAHEIWGWILSHWQEKRGWRIDE